MSTLQLHTKSYDKARAWADQYNSHLNQLAAHLMYTNNLMSVHFKQPSLYEDRKFGIDCWLEQERTKFSYRIRKAEAKPYFMEGFTIRTSAKHGLSELQKVQTDGYADFLLYAVAHPDNYGEVDAAVLIDLKSVGAQLKAHPHLIEQATKGNGFIDFNYDAFPYPVVVGMYGVKERGKTQVVIQQVRLKGVAVGQCLEA
jgi:hypothetical protein